MASIPDDRLLSEITMPGTHNTMALYGGVYAECQTWSLASQLRAGVRFLDIRVRHVNGNLTIHHGVSYQRAHFGDVLEGVTDFLQEYPTETVLMRLKEEFSETGDIYGAVVDYINRYSNWDLLWHSRLVPTMSEARGKIIILQNFNGPDLGMRYDSMDIADDWKVCLHFILKLPVMSAVFYFHYLAYVPCDPTWFYFKLHLVFPAGAHTGTCAGEMAECLQPLGGCTFRKQSPDFSHLQQWSRSVCAPQGRCTNHQPTAVRVPEGKDGPEPALWNHMHGLSCCPYYSNDH